MRRAMVLALGMALTTTTLGAQSGGGVAPHHELHQLRDPHLRPFARGHHPPVAEDGDAIGETADLLSMPPDAGRVDPTQVPPNLAATVRAVALRAIASDGRESMLMTLPSRSIQITAKKVSSRSSLTTILCT